MQRANEETLDQFFNWLKSLPHLPRNTKLYIDDKDFDIFVAALDNQFPFKEANDYMFPGIRWRGNIMIYPRSLRRTA